jgi:starvation-inducible DNA-binding protein
VEIVMHTTRHDLPADSRQKLVTLLNDRLADLLDLQSHAKQAHWNVKGPNFVGLHELFDSVASAAGAAADDVAERAVALGGTAIGTINAVSKHSHLQSYPLDLIQGIAHVNALATSVATTGKLVRTAIDDSAKLGDADTSDLFTGMSRELDKLLWMLEAHIQAEK